MTSSGWTLNQKTVFITGGSRGIGAETGKRLAMLGANVALVDLEQDVLEATAAQIPGAATFVADVTDGDALQAAVDGTVEHFGGIDVAFANAGIAPTGMVRSIDPEAWERTIEINLVGVWRTVRACLPHVIERRGYMLPVASMAAIAHLPGMSAYCATKAGVEAFANSLRNEVAHLGVDVGCAYFSWIDTPMVRGADERPSSAFMRSKLKGPLGKTFPIEDAVNAVVKGMQGRSRLVLAPGWLRIAMRLRGMVQPLADRDARKLAPEFDRLVDQEIAAKGAKAASAPVGPGGAAATAAAARRTPAA